MRVVVTGMGVVSSVGVGVDAFWSALCAGRSGIKPISRFDTTDYTFQRAGEVPGFDNSNHDLATAFMMAAAKEAWGQSGLVGTGECGVVLATNFGGITSAEQCLGGADDGELDEYSFQRAADHVCEELAIRGPRQVLSLSCASGSAAIGCAVGLIRSGQAARVLVGGYDAISRFAWSGLSVLRTMTKDEIRPFDKTRAGTIFSEGSAALVLESADSAAKRDAPVLAEVAGYALNNNAYHMTAPSKDGAGSAAVMKAALRDAHIDPGDVDHVNAHGTGTKYNDVTESQAIRAVLGEHADKVPTTSIKSMIGHMMGGAGTVEAVATVMSIKHGIVPPTINHVEDDPECDLDYPFDGAIERDVRVAISNSAGIGGCNAALVLRAATERAN